MTKSIQSEVMTMAWKIFEGRTELAFDEKFEDVDIYDFSEVLKLSWSEVKSARTEKSESEKQDAWKAPIGKKILEDAQITIEEYRSTDLGFVTSNKMGTSNLFKMKDGRQIWISARQEEMISSYIRQQNK